MSDQRKTKHQEENDLGLMTIISLLHQIQSLQKIMHLHVCTIVVHMMHIFNIIFTTYVLCDKYNCKYEVMQI